MVYPQPIFIDPPSHRSHKRRDEGELVDPLGSDDFVDIRQYVPGDPIKNILWRSFARTDNVMVKRYASYIEPRQWFDFADLEGDIEHRLSCLTGLALTATRLDQEFGLRLPNVEVTPGVGSSHLEKVLQELALFGVKDRVSTPLQSKDQSASAAHDLVQNHRPKASHG